jgi:hypothetical protein
MFVLKKHGVQSVGKYKDMKNEVQFHGVGQTNGVGNYRTRDHSHIGQLARAHITE